jgi:hypothetical protein
MTPNAPICMGDVQPPRELRSTLNTGGLEVKR